MLLDIAVCPCEAFKLLLVIILPAFVVIHREMQRPSQVFTEAYDNCELKGPDDECDTLSRTVRRPVDLPDAQLPAAFCQTTGVMVYEGACHMNPCIGRALLSCHAVAIVELATTNAG